MEPSKGAKRWYIELMGADDHASRPDDEPRGVLCAYDAGYLAALRDTHENGRLFLHHQVDLMALRDWLDRRIAELEGR